MINMQEEKLEHICSSIEEAEKKIYQMILHQTPQNRIAETTFVIQDIKRRFNPATISKIKKKFEQNNTIVRKDPVTAKLFREFREGFGVVDVQIKTKDEAVKAFVSVLNNSANNSMIEITALNAAGGLIVANIANSFEEGLEMALGTIKSGTAYTLFEDFVRYCGDVKQLERFD